MSRNVTFVVDNDDARLGRAIYFEYRNESMRVNAFRPTEWADLHAPELGYVRRNGRGWCIRQPNLDLSSDEMRQWLPGARNLRDFVRRNERCSCSCTNNPRAATSIAMRLAEPRFQTFVEPGDHDCWRTRSSKSTIDSTRRESLVAALRSINGL